MQSNNPFSRAELKASASLPSLQHISEELALWQGTVPSLGKSPSACDNLGPTLEASSDCEAIDLLQSQSSDLSIVSELTDDTCFMFLQQAGLPVNMFVFTHDNDDEDNSGLIDSLTDDESYKFHKYAHNEHVHGSEDLSSHIQQKVLNKSHFAQQLFTHAHVKALQQCRNQSEAGQRSLNKIEKSEEATHINKLKNHHALSQQPLSSNVKWTQRWIPSWSPLDYLNDKLSAVLKRNKMSDFDSWENCLSSNAKERFVTYSLSPTTSCGSKDGYLNRSVQALASSHILVMNTIKKRIDDGVFDNRVSPDALVHMLKLDSEDEQLLRQLRKINQSNSFVKPWLGFIDQTLLDDVPECIPLVSVREDIWWPHYKEYVLRSVTSFRRRLLFT